MTTRRLFICIFFVVVLAKMLTVAPTDPDLWWHLRTGEYIVNNGIPDQDPGFSYITEGREWFMHEWLSELIMWITYDFGGMHGVMLLYSITLASIFFALYFASPSKPYIAAFIVFFGVIASSIYLGPRPQMFNLLLGAVFVLIIEKVRIGAIDRRWMLLLPLLTVLWANLHSGFLLGPVILGVYIAGGLFEQFIGYEQGLSSRQIRYFSFIGLLIVLASLVNPRTYRLWLYPFTTTFNSPFIQDFVQDFQSPNFHNIQHWAFGTYLLFGIVIIARSRNSFSPTELLFIVGTLAASLQQRRNIPIHVIVSVPIYTHHVVSAFHLEKIVQLNAPSTPLVLRRVNILVFALLLAVTSIYISTAVRDYDQVVESRFPVSGVDFLQDNDLDDVRIFNNFNWGGYLIWRGIPTFVDGRADLFGAEILDDFAQIQYGGDKWQKLLDEYNFELVMIDNASPLTELLKLMESWVTIFEKENVIIFQKNINQNEEVLSKESITHRIAPNANEKY